MSTQTYFLRLGMYALATVMFVLPFVARAAPFGSVELSKPGKVTLTAQAAGFAAKGGSIDAPPATPITLSWTVPKDWKTCYSNWQTDSIPVTEGVGKIEATIDNNAFPRGRVFVLTCVGIGQAQTVAVKVNIVKPDITIASFSAIGKEPIAAAPAIAARAAVPEKKDASGNVIQAAIPAIAAVPAVPKNTYKAGDGSISFSAVLRNAGKTSIPGTPPIKVVYGAAKDKIPNTSCDAGWEKMGPESDKNFGLVGAGIPLAPGAVPTVTTYVHKTDAGGPWYFCVRADSTGVVDESSETNNTRVIQTPFYFR